MTEAQRTRQTLVGLLCLCFLLYFWELGHIPFYNYEESKEALIVWEMMNGGGWILPMRNGAEIPLKPPLFHWFGAFISFFSGKVNEFSVRSPSAIFATATVVLTFFFARRMWNWRVGLFSALILAASPEWLRWAVYARSDMVMVFFLTLAGFSFFWVWQERAAKEKTLYLLYASIGLATLAKGPLGIVLPALTIVTFLYMTRELDFLKRLRLRDGAVIVFVIAASWYLLAWWFGGWEFFRRQILDENVFRFFDSEQGGPSRDHPFYYYVPTLFANMLPWSLFFPVVGYVLYRARPLDKKLLYLVIWLTSGFLFFTLASGKRANYLLPLYPPIALLLGVWWKDLVEGSFSFTPGIRKFVRVVSLVVCVSLGAIVLALAVHGLGVDLTHWVSPFLHPRDASNLPIVSASLQQQFAVVGVWLIMLVLAISWYIWGWKQDEWMYVFAALTVASSSTLYFTKALFHPLLAQERTYKPFMLGVRSTVKNAPLYFASRAYDYGAIFYADRRIPVYAGDLADFPLNPRTGEPSYLLVWEEDWPKIIGTSDLRFEHLVASDGKGPDKKHRLALIMVLPSVPHAKADAAKEPETTVIPPSAEPPPAVLAPLVDSAPTQPSKPQGTVSPSTPPS